MANDDVLALVQELAKRIDALEKRDTETRSNVRTGFWDLPRLFPWVGDAKISLHTTLPTLRSSQE
jgi:hypothetical protein